MQCMQRLLHVRNGRFYIPREWLVFRWCCHHDAPSGGCIDQRFTCRAAAPPSIVLSLTKLRLQMLAAPASATFPRRHCRSIKQQAT